MVLFWAFVTTAVISALLGALALSLWYRRRTGAFLSSKTATGGDTHWIAGLVDGHRPPAPSVLFGQLLGLTRQVSESDGVVYLVPRKEGWSVAFASPGLRVAEETPRREGLTALAFEGEKELTAESIDPLSLGYLKAPEEPVSVVIIPSFHRGVVRGLLIAHRGARSYTSSEVAMVRRCEKLLRAWGGFFAYSQEISTQRDQGERLARGLELLSGERDPQEVCGLALDALFDLLPALYGYAVVQSLRFDCSYLVSKKFGVPDSLNELEEWSWTYWIMTRGKKPLYLDGTANHDSAMPLLYTKEPFPAGHVAYLHPMKSGDHIFGLIGIVGKEDVPFAEEAIKAADRFIKQVSSIVVLALLDRQNEERAITDGLTGLYNRRYFDDQLPKELSRSRRDGAPTGLIIFDIDHFKRINDSHGHPVGDAVLRETAGTIKDSLRDIDVLCRYGGEEFAAILPGCLPKEARATAERVRQTVASRILSTDLAVGALTLSAGVASFPAPFRNAGELVKAADVALYKAKEEGRNRVVVAR